MQKCSFCCFVQSQWIGSSRGLGITKKKKISLRVFRIMFNSAEFWGWKQLPHLLQCEQSFGSFESIQQRQEGWGCQRCQLASQIKQNIWCLYGSPKTGPKDADFSLKRRNTTHLLVLGKIFTVGTRNRQHIHVSVSVFSLLPATGSWYLVVRWWHLSSCWLQ